MTDYKLPKGWIHLNRDKTGNVYLKAQSVQAILWPSRFNPDDPNVCVVWAGAADFYVKHSVEEILQLIADAQDD